MQPQSWNGRAIRSRVRARVLVGGSTLLLAALLRSFPVSAQDATWVGNTSDWDNSTNWSPATQPTGTATFDSTGATKAVTFSAASTTIGAMQFNAAGSSYAFTLGSTSNLLISGAGITSSSGSPTISQYGTGLLSGTPTLTFANNSGAGDAIINGDADAIQFDNTASAGTSTINASYANLTFSGSSTAASATITNVGNGLSNANSYFTAVNFLGNSTAGSANIVNNGGVIVFRNSSAAGNAAITNSNFGEAFFFDSSSAGTANITTGNGDVRFNDTSTAGSATITGSVLFEGSSTADNATITNTGFSGFYDTSTGGSATIIVASSYEAAFLDQSTGGNAQITIENTSGAVDFSFTTGPANNKEISAGSIGGTGTYYLGANQLTVGGNNLSTTVSGVIADGGGGGGTGGSIVKIGTGVLTLSGANTFTGGTTVNGGTLAVNGSIIGGVAVNSGGTLSGTGTVGGDASISSGGILAPGAAGVGTLRVNGNLTLASGAVYAIAPTPNFSGLTSVNGSADLAGTFVLSPSGAFTGSEKITVLTAAGGVSGSFSTLDVNGAGIEASLSYDANDVFVTLQPESIKQMLPAGAPLSASNVAAAIDYAVLHDNAYTSFESLYGLSASDLEKALSQMTGEQGIDAAQGAFALTAPFMDTLTPQFGMSGTTVGRFASDEQRLTQVAFAGPAIDTPLETYHPRAWNVWTTAYGGWSNFGGDETGLGTHGFNSTQGGVAAGLDYRIDRNSIVGAAAGIGRTSWTAKDDLGSGQANAVQFGFYDLERIRALSISIAAAYSLYHTTTNRDVNLGGANTYRGKFDPDSEAVHLKAERWIAIGKGVWIAPYLAGQGQFYQSPAYVETTVSGSSSYALSYASKSQSDVTSDVGLELDQLWHSGSGGGFGWNAQMGWVHQYAGALSDQASFSAFAASDFTAYGTRGPKDAGRFAIGGTTAIADSLSLDVRLQTLLSGTSQSYGGNATLNYRW